MSKQFISGFSARAESYATSANYATCESRKELLNSVNQSNVNHRIILEEGFTTLLHAAVHLGDKFMCDRILSLKGVNFEAKDSNNKTALEVAKEDGNNNKAALSLISFLEKGNMPAPAKKNVSFISRILSWVGHI